MNVGLIGFSCSGKTSLLSFAEDSFDFVKDTDAELSNVIGSDFYSFIDLNGEVLFRKAELGIIKDIAGLKNAFVAFGGGVNYMHSGYRYIKDSFKLIYIQESFETLLFRAQLEGRPLLEINGEENYFDLYKSRLPLYCMAADFIVVSENRTSDLIWKDVKWIIDTLQN